MKDKIKVFSDNDRIELRKEFSDYEIDSLETHFSNRIMDKEIIDEIRSKLQPQIFDTKTQTWKYVEK